MKKIYLDYAAATPVDPGVFRAMKPYFSEKFGNPGSLHAYGQEAITALDRSRETIARAIGAEFREIIFTASATEANNLALRGVVRQCASAGVDKIENPRIIISVIEHESVLETARELAREGVEVVYLPVNKQGIIDLKKLKESLDDRTILVSLMCANNEIGTIQPIAAAAKIIKEHRVNRPGPLFHTDAAQAFQFLDGNVKNLGVDLMTLSAHKIYGPKGAGALYIAGGIARPVAQSAAARSAPAPIITGGGQEFGFRSGTENVPAIVGFAKAVEIISKIRAPHYKKSAQLREYLWRGIKKSYPKAQINGGTPTLPNILNIYFPGCAAQDLLTKFDLNGLAVSSGSACRSRAMERSYVIEALSAEIGESEREPGKDVRASSSIRFSVGRPTTWQEITAALAIIKKCL